MFCLHFAVAKSVVLLIFVPYSRAIWEVWNVCTWLNYLYTIIEYWLQFWFGWDKNAISPVGAFPRHRQCTLHNTQRQFCHSTPASDQHRISVGGNSLDKLRHTRSVAYLVELVMLNKHQISGGWAYLHCYPVGVTYHWGRDRDARSPIFYGRSRISAPVSRLPEGSRPGDRISHTWLHKSFMQRTLWKKPPAINSQL